MSTLLDYWTHIILFFIALIIRLHVNTAALDLLKLQVEQAKVSIL